MTDEGTFVFTDFQVHRPQHLVINGEKDWMVRISYVDGSVEINPEYSVDEAAKAFWDAVSQYVGSAGR